MLKAVRSRLTYANAMATGAMFLALGGGAYALTGIPDRGGVYHGCVDSKAGALRVVKAASSCHKTRTVTRGTRRVRIPGESAITWNQQGRPGQPGQQGQSGQQGQQGTIGPPGVSGYQVVLFPGIVQPTDTSGAFSPSCPAGKRVLGGGVSTFNKNIQITQSTPDDTGQFWLVSVVPFTGSTFGGSMGGSAVNIRIVCGTVAG